MLCNIDKFEKGVYNLLVQLVSQENYFIFLIVYMQQFACKLKSIKE
jgi:hypothetical protein